MESPGPASGSASAVEELVYTTFSYCPRCVLIEQKGLHLLPAKVIIDDDRVWLVVECDKHGYHRTLYCSDVPFFLRTLMFTYEKSQVIPDVADLEDLKKKLQYSPKSSNLPLTLELPLWDAGEFISDQQLAERVRYFKSLYPANREFIVKMLGKLAMDMPTLNAKAKHVVSLLPQSTLIFETSYERLVHLCHLPDSVFSHPNIYPALKYYLRRGDEDTCIQELVVLFKHLKSFSDVQLMITLSISRPYADLTKLLNFLREQYGFVRLILISMERSPNDLVSSLLKKPLEPLPKKTFEEKMDKLSLSPTDARAAADKQPPARSHPSARPAQHVHSPELSHIETADIFELLQHVQKCTFNSVSVDDFYPLSMGAALEPFLNMMGYGHYFIRPSPFCGFITCLVNSGKSFNSYPVTRLYDFTRIYNELVPLVPRLADGKVGLINAKRVKKVFESCVVPNKGAMPDIFAYLTEKSKAAATKQFIHNLQFIVVHNNMDIAALDMARRCSCSAGAYSTTTNGVVSYCTGCI